MVYERVSVKIIEDEASTLQTGELNLLYVFLANVNFDGKHFKQIKEIDIQQCLLIETAFRFVADEEIGQRLQTTGSRKSVKGKWRLFFMQL